MHNFTVWAPIPKKVALKLNDADPIPMRGPDANGYWNLSVDAANTGDRYGFVLDDDPKPYPDPRSLYQPDGVHNLSATYDQKAFEWSDVFWQGPPLTGAILYELHIGTFTPEGTFDGAIDRLQYLHDLGITHIELMPVAEFAGSRGWGYDGVDLFAVNHCYGGPDGLKRFVNACHVHGIGVILDVVYNHFGPVGNYTGFFGPYTTPKHHTPWGVAINFEDRGSDEVRRFFIDNAIMWMRDYHVDGLRLDAIHEIIDRSAVHFLEQLSADVDNLSATLGRRLFLIAESDLNNPNIVRPIEAHGFGMDAQWSDDFHHSLATILFTDPGHKGYYDDFGEFECLAKAAKDIFVFDGNYSKYRNRSHGRPVDNLSAHHFINFLQNHDQVGNRALGDRIHQTVGLDRTKVALGLVLTAPMVPMLFMGEEYAAGTPFLYFADHEDEEMARLVSAGRKKEFAAFGFDSDDIPNPEDPATFHNSRLNWDEINQGEHADMLAWTRSLIQLRRKSRCLNDGDRGHIKVTFSEESRWLRMDRHQVTIIANLGDNPTPFEVPTPAYRVVLTSNHSTTLEGATVTVPPNSLAVVSSEID
jgi:maltooligosyltrehalose trehalohydrolase